jgi:hypothetical protein
MTPKYWAGIVVGMLAIFGVGMLVARGVSRGTMFVENNLPVSLGLINADFRVNNHRIGDIQRLQFMRSSPGMVDSAVLTVKLTGDAGALQKDGCALRVVNAKPFGSHTHFLCTSAADSARLNLVPFGHIRLLPDNDEVTLYISADGEADVQHQAYRGTGSSDSGDVDIQAADGNFSITVNGREIVHASGDSNGGSFVVRDASGRPIVQISGDSNGGSIKVTDSNGKTRVNIHGSSVDIHGSSSRKDSTRDH